MRLKNVGSCIKYVQYRIDANWISCKWQFHRWILLYNCNLLNGCHLFLCKNVTNEKNGKLSGLLSHFFLIRSFVHCECFCRNAKVNKMLNGCYRWPYRSQFNVSMKLIAFVDRFQNVLKYGFTRSSVCYV